MKTEFEMQALSFALAIVFAVMTFILLGLYSKSSQARRVMKQAEKRSADLGWSLGRARALEGIRLSVMSIGVVTAFCGEELGLAFVSAGWFCPALFVSFYRKKRAEKIDQQVEAWLLQLARAMQSAPSLSDAIFVTRATVSQPLRHELKRLEESFQLGTSLPLGLEKLGQQVGRPRMKQAVVTMKTGLKSGGDLPQLLRRTGESMRELDRLGLVLRSKTAEGKTQALVISCSPLPLVIGVKMSEPDYFEPLFHSAAGQAYLGVALGLWLIAITMIRKILAVRL